jgi:hypothetical protein
VLRDVNASYNQIDFIPNSIGNMEGLHVGGFCNWQLRHCAVAAACACLAPLGVDSPTAVASCSYSN